MSIRSKKKKKPSRTALKKKADTLFSKLIRLHGKCHAKGLDHIKCKGVLQCAHIVGRSNMTLRWDENNALCLCQAHHFWYTEREWMWIRDFIPKNFPKQYKYVDFMRHEIRTYIDYDEVIAELEKRLDEEQSDTAIRVKK